MGDYSKLKSYLNETKSDSASTSINDGFNSLKSNVVSFFSNKNENGSVKIDLKEDQMDGWFKEAEKDKFCPSLSKKQRITGFTLFLAIGVFLMTLASFFIPVILLRPRKFVLLFSMGSLFFIASFSLLWGVKSHLKHLFSTARLPFTSSYFFSLFATIFAALWLQSVVLTLIFAVLQIISLIWYLISYLPGGQTGLKFFSKIFYSLVSKSVQTTLQV